MKKERKERISEELYVLTIVFSTERELFTRQKGSNSRRNIYSAFHNQHRVVQSNQSPNVRRTGSVTEFFKVKIRWILFTVGNVDRDVGRYSGRYSGRHSVDSRSTVGRYSVDTRSTLGRHSVDIAVDSRSIVGRQSVETRSIVVPDVSQPI